MKKSLKLMLMTSLLAAGLARSASAATVDVYITGSSAYRGAVTNAIGHLLTSPQAAFEGSAGTGAVAGANQQLITGQPNATGIANGLTAGTTYFFHTCWSGSLGGLTTLVYNLRPNLPSGAAHAYLPDTVTVSSMSVGSGAAGTTADNGTALGSDQTTIDSNSNGRFADGAFSDVFQSSTKFQSVTLTPATVAASNSDGIIGVVPFVFVANPDLTSFPVAAGGTFASNNPNMTATSAKALYSGGLDVAQLTGNATDDANSVGDVLAVGRDADSGTRFTTFAETGFNPVGGTSQPTQYNVTKSGSSIDVSEVPAGKLFAGTPAELDFSTGQSGYSSGGNERGALAVNGTSGANSDNPSYIIGSLGESDAIKIVAAGGPSYMAYNGVAYASSPTTTSSNPFNRTLIDQGVYTFWGYEHCYLDPQTTNAAALNAIAKEVRSVDAPIAGEIIANMAVQRSVEGGAISYVGVGQSKE